MSGTRAQGGCHCGALRVEFSSPTPALELEVRACQCSFCRRHGVRAVSDPQGELLIRVDDEDCLSRYSFSHRAADFLVCKRCGVYVAALLEHEGRAVATLNINVLDRTPLETLEPVPVHYGEESRAERIERRLQRWTPTRVSIGAAGE